MNSYFLLMITTALKLLLDHSGRWEEELLFVFLPPANFLKTAGGIVLGAVAVSAISADVSPYISVAIKTGFLKLGMCNICKNNIAKMFLDFFLKFKIVCLIRVFF